MPHIFYHTPSAQEVFDEACRYFATSPGPSIGDRRRPGTVHNDCAYRSPDGRVCVAGHFLPDEAYVPDMDDPEKYDSGSDVHSLIKHYGDRVPNWWATHKHLLKSLQSTHDEEFCWAGKAWNIPVLVSHLTDIAEDNRLDHKAIDLVRQREFNWDAVES